MNVNHWAIELKCWRRGMGGNQLLDFEIAAPLLEEAVKIARTRAAATERYVTIELMDAQFLGQRELAAIC